jgi:2-oxoglutarate ferredoxin oxidoreductase subunit delta
MVKIKHEHCKLCNLCVKLCPFKNLEVIDGKVKLKDPEKCNKCKICEKYCPEGGIEVE